jgi:drug/metabolite transporter (DMT)-like permease
MRVRIRRSGVAIVGTRSVKQGIVFALASALLFGASTPLAKLLLGSVSPLLLSGLLYAASGLGLLVVVASRALVASHTAHTALPAGRERIWLAGAILFGGIAGPVALLYGLALTPASTASLLLNFEAVFTALLAWFAFREHVDGRIALGMLAIVAGGAVLAWTPDATAHGGIGVLLIALACFAWALDNNLTRRISAADAVTIAGLKGIVAGAVNLGLAFALGAGWPAPDVLAGAAVVGFTGYGLSLVLFVLALRHLGTARAGAYFSVAPFVGALVALALQGDPVTWQLVAAGALMALGVWLHVTEHHGHVHAHERQEHSHPHVHDEHHAHAHDFAWDGREPHTHAHVHAPLVHAHAHYPDVHHRHLHRVDREQDAS